MIPVQERLSQTYLPLLEVPHEKAKETAAVDVNRMLLKPMSPEESYS